MSLAVHTGVAMARDGRKSGVVTGPPPHRQAVHIRLDVDGLDRFRHQGPGYRTRINPVLRSFVDSRRKSEAKSGT